MKRVSRCRSCTSWTGSSIALTRPRAGGSATECPPRRRRVSSDWSRTGAAPNRPVHRAELLARGQLLHGPAVPVRIPEEDELAPGELLDLARLDPALYQLGARGLDVRHVQLEALHRAGLGVDHALPE